MKLFRQTTSSRMQATTDKEDQILIRLSNRSPEKNAVELNSGVNKTEERLRQAGLVLRQPAKKPMIFQKNQKKMLGHFLQLLELRKNTMQIC
jgi:hypothetical protein